MAKSQNHTNHNQGFKEHRNGIKKPAKQYHRVFKGMDKKFRKNLHHVRKGNMKALRAAKKAAAAKETKA